MHHMIARMRAQYVFSHKLIVFPLDGWHDFCLLQSRVHEIWSWFFGTTFGSVDALTYNPTQVFRTFPFPARALDRLDAVGQAYHDFRAQCMTVSGKGLTDIYNRFNNPDETSANILELRRLHGEMDRAVLRAYGWDDLDPEPVFEREWEGYEEEKPGPWRYRWPEADRDEVLARLLRLNAERAAEEQLAAAGNGTHRRRRTAAGAGPLFGEEDDA